MADLKAVPGVSSEGRSLSPRQRAFVEEYMVDHNASAAALRAGYAKRNAKQSGFQLKNMPRVAAAILEAEFDRRKRLGVDADWIVARLVELVEKSMVGSPRTDRNGAVIRVLVGDEEVMLMDWSPSGANKALELLAKHLGMTVDRLEVSVEGGVVYTLNLDPLGDPDVAELTE